MGIFGNKEEATDEAVVEDANPPEQSSAEQVDDDFTEEDIPAMPFVPDGSYSGEIAKFERNDDVGFLKLTVLLKNNDGKFLEAINRATGAVEVLEDVPVDGNILEKILWDWKAGDEARLTKSGKFTKKGWAVKQFADLGVALGIEGLLNKNRQRELVANGDLIGTEVEVTAKTNDYNKDKPARHEIGFVKAVRSES